MNWKLDYLKTAMSKKRVQPAGQTALPEPPSVLEKNRVWHIGTMDPKYKKTNVYEGHALAVSEHPNEWEEIAQLGGNPWHELHKPKGRFIDFHACKRNKAFMNQVYRWAKSDGLIEFRPLYHVEWQDEEMEDTSRMTFIDFAEALEEAGYSDESEYRRMQQQASRGEVDLENEGYSQLPVNL